MNKYRHLYSINEGYTNGTWGTNNFDSKEKSALRNAFLPVNAINETKYISSLIPRNVSLTKVLNSYDNFNNNFVDGTQKAYVFDIETLGSLLPNAKESERAFGTIGELAVLSFDATKEGNNVIDSNYKPVLNITFGITDKELEGVNSLISTFESILNGDANTKGITLNSTELSTLKFLGMYGGEDITRIKSNGKYFSKVNGIYQINKHYKPKNEYDLDAIKQGVRNLREIGLNQGVDTKVGRVLLSNIINTFNTIKEEGASLFGYNIDQFDIPFLQGFLNKNSNNISSNIPIISELNTFDVRRSLQVGEAENMARSTYQLYSSRGESFTIDSSGTLSSQAKARGLKDFEAHVALEDAPITTNMFFKIQDDGTSLYSNTPINVQNKSKYYIETMPKDSQYVLKAKKASRIDSEKGVNGGMYDQYLVPGSKGDYTPVEYMSFATNKDMHYKINKYGKISKKQLELAHPNTNFEWETDQDFVYGLTLDNASTDRIDRAFIIRETEEEMQKVFNRFEVKQLITDTEKDLETAFQVTQGTINISTQRKIEDNARRKLASTREAKGGGIAFAKKLNTAYEKINDEYYKLTKESKLYDYDLKAIIEGRKEVKPDFIYNVLDEVFGNSNSAKDAFLYGYGKIQDEYNVTSKVISAIESNNVKGSQFATNYYNTMLYNSVLDSFEKDGIKYINGMNDLLGTKYDPITRMKNQTTLLLSEVGYDTVDIINPIGINSNKSIFNTLPINEQYFGVTATDFEDISYAIMNKTNSIASNSPKRLTKHQILNKQKGYLKSIAKDFRKRGVINRNTYNWYKEVINSVDNSSNLYPIYQQFGGDIMNIIEKAKGKYNLNTLQSRKFASNDVVGRNFKGLLVKDVNVTNIRSNTPFNNYSDFVTNSLYEGDLDKAIDNAISSYKEHSNITFIDNVAKKDEFFKSSAANWLRDTFGYNDENIETLTSALYGRNGIAKNSKDGLGMSTYFFTMKDKRGNDMPVLGIAKKNAKIEFNGNKLPDNMAYMILPKLDTNKLIYNYELGKEVPSIVKIGDVEKLNIGRLEVYSYYNEAGEKITKAKRRDLVSRSLNSLTINKKSIEELIEKGEYNSLTNKLNSTSKRVQLNERGVSQRIARIDGNGKKYYDHIVNKIDLDNANTVILSDVIKMLPILYEDSDSSIKANMQHTFKDGRAEKYINQVKNVIESNKPFTMESFSPELVEWIYSSANVLNDKGENIGIIAESMRYFNRMKDTKSEKVFEDLLKGHSFIKDSNMTDFLTILGPGIKANQLAPITGYTRSTSSQGRGSVPFMLEDFDYRQVEKDFNVKFGQMLISEGDMYGYNIPMSNQGNKVATGMVGNVKQMKTGDAYVAFRKATIDLDDESVQEGDKILKTINKRYGTDYTRKDLNVALGVLEGKTSFFEGGGLLKPGLDKVFNTEQVYSMEVGEDFFNEIKEGDIINNKQSLGKTRGGRRLTHRKDAVEVISKEEIGFDFDDALDKDKTFKVHYKFKDPTNPNMAKISTFGLNEKGVVSTFDLGEGKESLARGLFEELFGANTVAVSSSELFKHDSYGGIIASYINTIADYASDYDEKIGSNRLGDFVTRLNKEMPSLKYKLTKDPNTGRSVITHLNADAIKGDITNPFQAIRNIINSYKEQNDTFGKGVTSTIEYMDENQIFKTDISQLYMTDSYAQNAKVNNKMIQLGNIALGKDITDKTRLKHRSELRATKEYNEGHTMIQNIYASVQNSKGNMVGVVEDLDFKTFHFVGAEPTYTDIKNSKLFDFGKTNKYGAEINTFRLDLPEGLTVTNPLTQEEVSEIFLPSVKSYHLDDQIMLSKLQMAEEDIIMALNKYIENPMDVRNREYVQNKVNKFYSAMNYELVNKDGIKSRLMESIKYETGGMNIIAKMVPPEMEFEYNGEILANAPLDENGNLRKGTRIKGYLDRSYNDSLKYDKVGNVIGFYEDILYSEDALKSFGVNFESIGKQLVDGLDIEDSFKPYINNAIKDIEIANQLLKSTDDEVVREAKKAIDTAYSDLGKKYFTDIGVFQSGGRHPVMSKTSLGTQRVKLDPNQSGRTMIGNYVTILKKWFGDVDSDQSVGKLVGGNNNGVFQLLSKNSQEVKLARQAYEKSALDNLDMAIKGIEDYAKDFQDSKFIYSGNGMSPLDLAEMKAKETLGEELVENNFNLYDSKFHQLLAIKARTMKLAVPHPSIANYNIREVAEHLYRADANNYKYNDILDVTRLIEQNIISLKHLKDIGQVVDTTPVDQYVEAIELMTSTKKGNFDKGFEQLVGVFNNLDLFKSDEYVKHDVFMNGTSYEELPTDVHRQVYTLRETLKESDAKRFYKKQIESADPTEEKYLLYLKEAFSDDTEFINTESGINSKYIYQNATDIKYIEIGDKQLGVGSVIGNNLYEPHKITSMVKNHRDGFSKIELQDLYSGETTSIVADSFKEISRQLNVKGFDYIEEPNITTLDDVEFFDRRFASYDDFVRETIIEDTVGAFTNKEINQDRYNFLEAVNEQFNRFNLDETQRKMLEKDILNLSKEQKELYRESYKNKTKDIYFETENLINELRLTNTMRPDEVLDIANTYYKTAKVDLTAEMNNSIRQRAIHERKRKVYQDNIDKHRYTNLDSYIKHYKDRAKKESINFNGTTSIRQKRKLSLVNQDLNSKSFDELGNMTITIGSQEKVLNTVPIDDIIGIALEKTEISKDVSRETIEIAKHYVGKIDLKDYYQNQLIDNNRLGSIADTIQEAQNSIIKDMAKESTKQVNSGLINKTIDYVKHNKMKSAIVAGATIGLASAIVGKVTKQSALVPQNTSQEEVDERYATRSSVKDVAPRTNKTVLVQSPRTTKGVNYKVSSLNNGNADNTSLLKNLKGLIGNDANVRYKEEREEKQINESWLKEKLSNLI